MNKKDILELKRRFKKDACTFTRLCGCYVDARAAKKRQGCPKVPEMWGVEEAE